ncbi:MAG: LysR family transcriptional regulator [Phycisphaerae bacterium]
MNTDVLKTFCDLVDTGSFSKAAEANYISQSAVSQQLAKLEKELSTQLISRGAGLVAPTEAGRAFYQGAREILRRYEQLMGEVRSARDAVRGVLRVGTIYSLGFYLLEPFVRRFLQAHPEVNLHVEYTGWNRIYAAVISGEMDLGVVACPERHRFVEVVPLAGEELVVVCSPAHPLARRGRIEPADLNGQKFIAFEEGIPTRRFIDRLLHESGVEVNVVMQFDNVELLKRSVEVASGISILPLENVKREVEHGDLAYARLRRAAKWERPVAIIRRRGKAPGPAERMFLAILRTKP